jgi:alkylhydroperoxidase family enzyme
VSRNHDLLERRSSATAEGDAATMLAKLEAADSDLTILRYVANAPALLTPFVRFSYALLTKGVLPRPTIEVVVLRIAQRLDVPYEWAEHLAMAEQAGVPASVIEAIEHDDVNNARLDEPTLLALRVADALMDGGTVHSEDWQMCCKRFGTDGATELLLVVGWFAGLVRIVLTGLQLEEPA